MKKLLTYILSSLILFTINAQTQDQIFIEYLKANFKNFENKLKKNDGVFIDSKIVTLIIDADGRLVEGTSLPTVLKESNQYRYRVILLTSKGDSAKYTYKIDGKEYNPANEFIVLNTKQSVTGSTDEKAARTANVKMLSSDTSDVFSEKVFFEVKKNDSTLFKWDIKLLGTTNTHVAIMGGYFHSGLKNPTNIVKVPVFDSNNSDSTLIGDFTNHQRKLSVMAVFYPWQRSSDYEWKKLKLHERFSFGFGIGLDEDLFDDLFAGINLEFAKGGYVSGGVHCGKHNVLAIKSNFDFGNDTWNQPFDNSLIKEEWNISYYLGVIIDFRVITSMIGTRDKLNNGSSED